MRSWLCAVYSMCVYMPVSVSEGVQIKRSSTSIVRVWIDVKCMGDGYVVCVLLCMCMCMCKNVLLATVRVFRSHLSCIVVNLYVTKVDAISVSCIDFFSFLSCRSDPFGFLFTQEWKKSKILLYCNVIEQHTCMNIMRVSSHLHFFFFLFSASVEHPRASQSITQKETHNSYVLTKRIRRQA